MSNLKSLMAVFGAELERLNTAARRLLSDFFPQTAQDMLTEWETAFDLVHTGTTLERQQRITAYMAAVGGQSIDYFYGLAEKLGYHRHPSTTDPHIQILEGQTIGFRVGISRIGIDPVYDNASGASYATLVVKGTDVETDTDLQALFQLYKPAHTEISFVNS
jgi:uncharacterized protein YmfQ (DUF2313 family)